MDDAGFILRFVASMRSVTCVVAINGSPRMRILLPVSAVRKGVCRCLSKSCLGGAGLFADYLFKVLH